jgi:hypothetical protein
MTANAAPLPADSDEVNLCKGCGAMKHVNADGYCGRCVPADSNTPYQASPDEPYSDFADSTPIADSDGLDAVLNNLNEDMQDIANHGNDSAYQAANYPTQYTRSNINGLFGEAKAALLAIIAEKERMARDDELITAYTQVVGEPSVPIRSKFVKQFTKYLKERHQQLKDAVDGRRE